MTLFPYSLSVLKNKERIERFIHRSGEARRDWLYVADTLERIDRVLHAEEGKVRGEVFNLGENTWMKVEFYRHSLGSAEMKRFRK